MSCPSFFVWRKILPIPCFRALLFTFLCVLCAKSVSSVIAR